MQNIWLLENEIMDYAWGSYDAIPQLLGAKTPSEKPQAELWMGAHPKAPSKVQMERGPISLLELIQQRGPEILGASIHSRFRGKLPFLFKVLAAATPLSIQAHPTLEQAREGFEREDTEQIPIDAPHRNYKDSNHKPEVICALTPFWALKGFRAFEEIQDLLNDLGCDSLEPILDACGAHTETEGLRQLFRDLLTLPPGKREDIIREAVAAAKGRSDRTNEIEWLLSLHRYYPQDIGLLSPMILNLVQLKPGEALSLEAGELHAYLDGVGIELMANSDNVLRGGLTPKHIDVPELLRVLKFKRSEVEVIRPEKNESGERIYFTPFEEFLLSSVELRENKPYKAENGKSIEIWIVTGGEVVVTDLLGTSELRVRKGQVFLIPASVPRYALRGAAMLYRATVPPL
jgi:mannose-6-phosphate isomerase